jgi:hypothetical protein
MTGSDWFVVSGLLAVFILYPVFIWYVLNRDIRKMRKR